MRQLLIAIFAIVIMISLVVATFTINQVYSEEHRLKSDLKYRSTLLADSLKETVEPNFINKSHGQLQNLVNRFDTEERLAGMNIYDNNGNPIATSSSLPREIPEAKQVAADAMDQNKENGDFIEVDGRKMYFLAVPLHDADSVVGAMMIAQNAGYIDKRIEEIWSNNLVRLFVQAALLSIAVLILLRWIIYQPIRNMVESLKLARRGELSTDSQSMPPSGSSFLKPLIKEISNTQRSLVEARLAATEEAKLRLEKIDSPWTEQRLKVFAKDILKDRTIFLVSNREPYIHNKDGSYYIPASGMVTALEPMMEACQGMWIAQGSGDGDRLTVDENDKLQVPPEEPKYTLKRIWLTEEEEDGYYFGFSNSGLWPLCHNAYTRPTFKKEDWEEYKKVNGKFAQVILTEIKNCERPIVFIQDFHLSLVPRMIKKSRPDASVGIFWHPPWPNSESFSVCPWKKEILDGMLGADLVGFHTQLYCNNFIETVSRELESLIDFEQFTITRNEHISYIQPFPISIAFSNHSKEKATDFDPQKLLRDLNIKSKYIGLGVDRLDYTKGILEKMKAIEIFLTRNPEYVGNFSFIQISPPSRSKIKQYQNFALDVEKEIERVNNLFKKNGYKPIIFLEKLHTHDQINEFYKLTNICLITSLHDGMNLVAKEFVAARNDEKGVLILSQFTGAARELKSALIINPYNGEQTAEAIKIALELSPSEQTKRMRRLRTVIRNHNIYSWFAEILETLVNLG